MEVVEEEPEEIPNPAILRKRRMSICDECIELDSIEKPVKIDSKTPYQTVMLKNSARNVLIFRDLTYEEMNGLVDRMFIVQVSKGDRIIKQGSEGNFFYIVEKGDFEELHIHSNGKKDLITKYGPGSHFGEVALMYGVQATATVRATSIGVLWGLERGVFKNIVVKSAYKRRKSYESAVDAMPELSILDLSERYKITDVLISKHYEDHDIIVEKGDYADGIYFVLSEETQVRVFEQSGDGFVVKMKLGEYLGEGSILKDSPRLNTVHSVGPSDFAFLEKSLVMLLLENCMGNLRQSAQIKLQRRNSGYPVALV